MIANPVQFHIGQMSPNGPYLSLLYADAAVIPFGYCRGWPQWFSMLDKLGVEAGEEQLRVELGEDVATQIVTDYQLALPFRDRYHCDGHATYEEARLCCLAYIEDQYPGMLSPPDPPASQPLQAAG